MTTGTSCETITVSIPGKIADWLHEYEIDRVTPGMNAGEREWREQLATGAETRKRGKGYSVLVSVSRLAARELLSELEERAQTESDLRGESQIAPSVVFRFVDTSRKALGVGR